LQESRALKVCKRRPDDIEVTLEIIVHGLIVLNGIANVQYA
jgi:hypothetical protein